MTIKEQNRKTEIDNILSFYSKYKRLYEINIGKLRFAYLFGIFLLIIFSSFQTTLCENELARSLENEFVKIAYNYDPGWEEYFRSMTSDGFLKIDKFSIEDINNRLEKIHRFSSDVSRELYDIVYSDTVIYKTFSFSIKNNLSEHTEFIGAARVLQGKWVEIAYIQVNTIAELIPKYDRYEKQYCWTVFFFFNQCETYTVEKERAYTFNEIELIFNNMRAHSYSYLLRTSRNILSALQTKEFVLSQNSNYYSQNGVFLIRMQEDGNLVMYVSAEYSGNGQQKPIWHSNTYLSDYIGYQPFMLVIEPDGELVIYNSYWNKLWYTNTAGKGVSPRTLVVSNDGEVQLRDKNDALLWYANSGQNINQNSFYKYESQIEQEKKILGTQKLKSLE